MAHVHALFCAILGGLSPHDAVPDSKG